MKKQSENSKTITITIDRSKWSTGNEVSKKKFWKQLPSGDNRNYLFTPKGGMCCLGFACNQLGVPKKDLKYKSAPEELRYMPRKYVEKVFRIFFPAEVQYIVGELIRANDNAFLPNRQREQRVREKFKQLGLKAVFEGKYP